MARTRAPLLSWGASGKIADTQVYSTWKGRPYVRQHVIPTNPNSAGQQLTRNTFSYLNRLWQYLPAGALGAWDLYATNSRFTARNGWLKQNVGPLRSETDLELITLSPAAGSGIIAASITATGGNDQVTIDLVAPSLPTGWTITKAWAMVVANVDPQTSDVYSVGSGSDATSTYQVVITGLLSVQEYVCAAWFEYLKPDGSTAYGLNLIDTATTT